MTASKTLKNAGWLIGCRIIQSILSFVVSSLTARYLGPSNFGTINYAISLAAFFAPLVSLGLNSTLVQEVVAKPDKEGESIGTALGLNVASAIFCIIGLNSFVAVSSAGETETILVCSLYSVTLLAQGMEIIQYWFQAKLLSKYTAVIGIIAYTFVSAYKICLLITDKSVYWFAISNALDYSIIAISLILVYRKVGTQKLRFSMERAKQMLSISKHYIVSNMMVTVFGQIANIFLRHMIDDTAVGFYSAAISCAMITNFVFAAVIDSARPSILQARKEDFFVFERNIKRLYSVVIYLALAQSVVICLLSKVIVNIVYGANFSPTAAILRILIWYTPFSYIGPVRDIWILAEGKQSIMWIINSMGAIISIVFNMFFISFWGINGAAIACLMTQLFTNVILGCILPPIRHNNELILSSLNPKYIISLMKR